MKLTYRRAQYEANFNQSNIGLETVPTEITGVYRGQKFYVRKLANPPTSTGFAALTYRRATYRSLRYTSPELHLS